MNITYSDIQGGYEGQGNIDEDPLFVSGSDGDYCLSQIASWQTEQSPCVDAGEASAGEVCFESDDLSICMNELTTKTNGAYDYGLVDMGYHYRQYQEFPAVNLFGMIMLILAFNLMIFKN